MSLERTVIDGTAVAIVVIASNGTVEICNSAAAELFGYAPQEILGQDFCNLLSSPLSKRDLKASLQEQGASLRRLELTGLRKEGGIFSIELVVNRIRVDDRCLWVGVVHKLTAYQRLEAQFGGGEGAAAQGVVGNCPRDLLTAIGQEIRSPLNIVLGSLSLLLRTSLDQEQRNFAETANQSGKALLTLIDSVLDFVKIEAGRLKLEETAVDIIQLVEGVAESLAPRVYGRGIDIFTLVSPNVPRWLRADAERLRQVLLNVANSVLKLTQKDGMVIRVNLLEEGQAERVRLHFEVNSAIPEAVQTHPASAKSADSNTANDSGCMGMSLEFIVSKRLVEMMGGGMGCSCQKGNACWFTIECAGISARSPQPDLPSLGGLRVLLVEGNPLSCRIHEQLLQAWGVEVISVKTGKDTLPLLRDAQLRGVPFDVVLIDEKLPDIRGEELGSAILGLPHLATSRLILMTRLVAASVSTRLRKLGFCASLTKPIRQVSLYHWLCVANGLIKEDILIGSRGDNEESPVKQASLRRGRILVAEDSQVNQIVMVAMLEKAGYQVDAVSNGLEAIEAVQAVPYALVLMDMSMPEMDGLEAAAKIRRLSGPLSRIPIIAITADEVAEAQERCLAAGMNDCLTKPIDQVRLLAVLERWLPISAPRAEPTATPVLDWQTLRQLEADTDLTVLDRAISLFIDEANARLNTIAEARLSKDWQRLKKEAHALKSSASTFGVKRLHQHAQRLDEACQQGDWETALTLAESIDDIAAPDLELLAHHYCHQR